LCKPASTLTPERLRIEPHDPAVGFRVAEDVDAAAGDDPLAVDGVRDHSPPHRRKGRNGAATDASTGDLQRETRLGKFFVSKASFTRAISRSDFVSFFPSLCALGPLL